VKSLFDEKDLEGRYKFCFACLFATLVFVKIEVSDAYENVDRHLLGN